ncbi:hypothetical protein C8R43DRAFT_1135511 [Mycena crocata]|nr:hypothetical protein C8R43DRAFT_1135511 [Mycena crocata]
MSSNANTQSSGPSVPPGLAGQPGIVQKCSLLVQEYRDGKIGKSAACTKIMQAIPSAFVENGAGEKAAQAYFDIIDQTEKELIAAAERGGAGGSVEPQPSLLLRMADVDTVGTVPALLLRMTDAEEADPVPALLRRIVDHSMLPWLVEEAIIEPTLTPTVGGKATDEIIFPFWDRVLSDIDEDSPPLPTPTQHTRPHCATSAHSRRGPHIPTPKVSVHGCRLKSALLAAHQGPLSLVPGNSPSISRWENGRIRPIQGTYDAKGCGSADNNNGLIGVLTAM